MAELEQVVRAIAVASDPAQAAIHQDALNFLSSVQQNAEQTWQLALNLFVAAHDGGQRKYSPETRFFALRVLDEFLDNRLEPLDDQSFTTLQQALVTYIQSEYIYGPAESNASFLRNKFSHTLTLFFLCTYSSQWPTFFTDFFTFLRPDQGSQTYNKHVSLLFFHLVLEISGEVADQLIKSARSSVFSSPAARQARENRDAQMRDAVRERDAAKINEAVLTIVSQTEETLKKLREENKPEKREEMNKCVEIIEWGVKTYGSYVGWIDINLTITPETIPLLFSLLADPALPIRLSTALALLRIVVKGLKEPGDKLQLLKVLSLGEVLDALESKTRQEQTQRGDDVDEGEESYREALGKLLNAFGQELYKLNEDATAGNEVKVEASTYLKQIIPTLLRFMSDSYDDTSNTVFPLTHQILSGYKRARKYTASSPPDETKQSFLVSLLQVILQKMKWNEDVDSTDDPEDEEVSDFEHLRRELQVFLEFVLAIDRDLAVGSIKTLTLNTISAYQSGASVKWNEVELAVFLVYVFGEINKEGTKGRGAFCEVPTKIDKEKRKTTNYSEYALTTHGEMMMALVQSGLSSHPHRAVTLQFFEAVSRYPDFFKVRRECIVPTLEAMVDSRGLHNPESRYRLRLYYLFYRFIKDCRNDISVHICAILVDKMRDLLPLEVVIPDGNDSDGSNVGDPLAQAVKNSTVESQLYLYETVGIAIALLFNDSEAQNALLLSVVRPLLDELSMSLQAYSKTAAAVNANGLEMDIVPVAKTHHVIMALGNIAKGFPDYPSPVPPGYVEPPIAVFTDIAQAILVCLENLKAFKPIRDATRFAYARILAMTGPSVMHFIPPLMTNLLSHFEPSELVDFMSFIGLLVHKLQGDMFVVLDELIGPLTSHIGNILSQSVSGTDEQRAQVETKRGFLTLLNSIITYKLHGVFISDRNKGNFEALIEMMMRIGEDVSDPQSGKTAFLFLERAVTTWGQPLSENGAADGNSPVSTGLPGFERVIYERIVPSAFRVPNHPQLNAKDGQTLIILHEIANILQAVGKTRGQEAYDFFVNVYLPSQNWPTETATDFTTKLRDLDAKNFRKYFSDFVRSSRSS